MVHAIHDGPNRGLVDKAPYVVYHNGAIFNFTTITPFPGAVNNCLGCHEPGTFASAESGQSRHTAGLDHSYGGLDRRTSH